MQELITLDTLRVLLDLFFKYQWNNFLHTQVELCITSALKAQIPEELGDSNALCKHVSSSSVGLCHLVITCVFLVVS